MTTGNHILVTHFILLRFGNHPELSCVLFVVFLSSYLIALTGNLLMIIRITMADTALCTPMYFFLRNLSFLEISYTLVTLPKILANPLSEDKTISFLGCFTQTYFLIFLRGLECHLLAVMAYDRYVTICHPLPYPVLTNRRAYVGLAAASWVTSLLVLMGHIANIFTLPFRSSNEITHFLCDVPPVMEMAYSCAVLLTLAIGLYCLNPWAVLLTLAVGLYCLTLRTVIVTLALRPHCRSLRADP